MMAQMSDDLSKEKYVELSASIHEASKNVFKLLANLLEWSRLQMEGSTFVPQECSVFEVVQECYELLSPSAKDKEVALVSDIENDQTVLADRDMLLAIIRNLTSNAIKFSFPGSKVDIRATHEDEAVKITVFDTGVGMTEEQIENIFSVGQKTSTDGTAGETGTGLGLPLCKEMVERNGGHISVTSSPGIGSTFVVVLPDTLQRSDRV